MMGKGLQVNRTLQVLKMGKNPFQGTGACFLLKSAHSPRSVLHELHLDDIVFDHLCEQELNAVLSVKANFICSWNVNIKGGRVDTDRRKPEVWEIFLGFLRIRGWRLMDIFKILAKEKDAKYLTLNEFLVGLKKQNIPMNDKQIRELFTVIDTGGDGFVEFTEFCALNPLRVLHNRALQLKKRALLTKRKTGATQF